MAWRDYSLSERLAIMSTLPERLAARTRATHAASRVALLLGAVLLAGCHTANTRQSPVPSALLGAFTDDYGTSYRISPTEFAEGRSRYRVVEWNTAGQFLLAQNADSNRTDGGRWSRFDWLLFTDQGAYRWGYCHSAWRAPSLDSARSTAVVQRAEPRRGCNGHPFTRMRAASETPR